MRSERQGDGETLERCTRCGQIANRVVRQDENICKSMFFVKNDEGQSCA